MLLIVKKGEVIMSESSPSSKSSDIWSAVANLVPNTFNWIKSELQKDAKINSLEMIIQQQNKEIEECKKKIEELTEKCQYFQKELDDADVKYDITKITGFINRTAQEAQEINDGFKACDNAGHMVEIKANYWIEQAMEPISKKYQELLTSKEQVENFKQDLCKYMEWLSKSLHQGRYLDLTDFITVRSIGNPIPYQAAIEDIKKQGKESDLKSAELHYFEMFLDHLKSEM